MNLGRQMKKISIVIPSYNQGKYIKNTIESIVRQGYENYEIIVADGYSSDTTIETLKYYKDRLGDKFTYIYEKDNGFADGVNKGLAKASGDILGIQSSDDMYTPNTFNMIGEIYLNSNPLLVLGQRLIVNTELDILRPSKFSGEASLENLFKKEIYPFQDATFFSRDAFDKAGYLNIQGDYAADWGYWIKVLSFGNGIVVDNYFSYYTVHENQRIQTRAYKFSEDYELIVRDWINSEYYENVKHRISKEIAMAGVLLNRAYWYKENGKNNDALLTIESSFSQYPFCKEWNSFKFLLYKVGGIKALLQYYGIKFVISKGLNKVSRLFYPKGDTNIDFPDPKIFLN